eukprot:SAG11_NODE_3838_length_2195_cov_2.830153_2_plen_91_part_00
MRAVYFAKDCEFSRDDISLTRSIQRDCTRYLAIKTHYVCAGRSCMRTLEVYHKDTKVIGEWKYHLELDREGRNRLAFGRGMSRYDESGEV